MLDKQNVSVSFAQGVDSKTDPYQVVAGKLLTLENGVWNKLGRLDKRPGYTSLSRSIQTDPSVTYNFSALTSSVASGRFLAAFNNEQVLGDGLGLYSYSPSVAQWVYKGRATACTVSSAPVVRNINSQSQVDSALSTSGARLFAWEDSSGGIRMSVTDATTGQVFVANYLVSATGSRPRCVAAGALLVLFYWESTGNTLNYVTVNNGTVSAPVIAQSDVATAHPNFDVCQVSSNLVVAYNCSANTNNSIKLAMFTGAMVAGPTLTLTASKADNCITVFGASDGFITVAMGDGTVCKFITAQPDLSAFVTTVSSLAIVATAVTGAYNTTSTATLFIEVRGSAVGGNFVNSVVSFQQLQKTGTAGGLGEFMRGVCLSTKAFMVNGISHVGVVRDCALQPTYLVLNQYNSPTYSRSFNLAAVACSSVAGGPPPKFALSSVNVVGPNVFQVAALQKDLLYTATSTTGTVNTFSQTGVMSLGLDFTAKPNTITEGQNLLISSGLLLAYDGQQVVEHGFLQYPEGVTASGSTTGGLLGAGSYGYQVLYEWTDAQGQTHQSAASPVVTVTTTTATSSCTLTIPTLRQTMKADVNIVVYRTAVNGTIYFRVNLPSAPKANSISADTVSFVDTASDASLAANQQLYTTGGEVENIAAPAPGALCTFKNRVILIPTETPGNTWWFSKQVVQGYPVELSDLFAKNVSADGGPLTAAAQLDANLILFKARNIFWVQGEGPAPSGVGDDFSEAQAIPTDVGCSNPSSIVLTPQGLMFQSAKGLFLLNRGMQIQYIGQDVEGYVLGQTVSSAQLMASVNQVRFTMDSGVTLVLDLLLNQWSVFTNINAVGSIMSQGVFTYLNGSGKVYQETAGLFTDDGAAIKLRLVSSWLSFAGLQAFQRVYKLMILGSYVSTHKLLVKVAYDFNSAFVQETYVDATTALNPSVYGGDLTYGGSSVYGGPEQLYEFRVNLNRQKCSAIQFSIEDVQTVAPYGAALTLSAMGLEVGSKKGLNKKGASRSYGG